MTTQKSDSRTITIPLDTSRETLAAAYEATNSTRFNGPEQIILQRAIEHALAGKCLEVWHKCDVELFRQFTLHGVASETESGFCVNCNEVLNPTPKPTVEIPRVIPEEGNRGSLDSWWKYVQSRSHLSDVEKSLLREMATSLWRDYCLVPEGWQATAHGLASRGILHRHKIPQWGMDVYTIDYHAI